MGTSKQVKQWYANNTPEVLLLYTVLLHIHYAESKTMHTDGLEDIEFPKYMVELCCNVHSGGSSAH